MIELTLTGRIPSKKNSKRIVKSKKGKLSLVSSINYMKWHKEASMQLKYQKQAKNRVKQAIKIELEFTFGDKRKTDLTNKAESVMDLLVDNGTLDDDNWMVIPEIKLSGTYEKDNFKCFIKIF